MSVEQSHKKIPSVTLAVRILIIIVSIGSILVTVFGWYSQAKADGERIFYEGEPYRLITGIFAVGSISELGFLLICFVWMLFQVTEYEKKHSTVYTFYHFWLVNLNIYFNVVSLFLLLFRITTMKNFNMNVVGIYPYCLYMYLKTCLYRPKENTNYWFMPFPMSRWTAGFLVALFSVWFSTETQGCIIVSADFLVRSLIFFILRCCNVECEMLKKQGPMFPCLFVRLEKCLFFWARGKSGFISMEESEGQKIGQEASKPVQVQMVMND